LAEPPIHVTVKKFEKEVSVAQEVGFKMIERPRVRWSHAALLGKA
jgi:hypothetical protein